jgi:hypothetical protein
MAIIHRILHAAAPGFRKRSSHASPAVIGDSMAPLRSMLDGRHYDSKSALRATYRRAGVTEVGNDPAIHRKIGKPRADRRAVSDAVRRAFAQAGLE